MTLGIFMPLLTLAMAPVAALLFLKQLRALPERMSPDYDEQKVTARARVLRIAIGWQFAMPIVLYLIFNMIAPDVGSLELF